MRIIEAFMYELIFRLPASKLALEQFPQLAIPLTIAELFYKFQTFLLGTRAFLVTSFVVGAAHAAVRDLLITRGGGR
jgi:hypothetical protein